MVSHTAGGAVSLSGRHLLIDPFDELVLRHGHALADLDGRKALAVHQGVGIGAGDGFVEAIVGGGYRWIGYGFIITVLPLMIVGLFARLKLKINYYTLMGLLSGSMTNPPALGYSNATSGNDMPALGYATVYPVVMFLRVLTAQMLILMVM